MAEQTPSHQASLVHTLSGALARAYAGRPIPAGLLDWLTAERKPGSLCTLFYSGCDGSLLAHSYFESGAHPRVIAGHPTALSYIDSAVSAAELELFNSGVLGRSASLEHWCALLVERFADLFTPAAGPSDDGALRVDRDLFKALVHGQLLALRPGGLDWDTLVKTLLLAHACARGLPLECDSPPVYLWHAYTPSVQRRAWMRAHLPGARQITVVRYPEKSLDIHLVRHGFEAPFPPLLTLFRRLFLDWMAVSFALPEGSDDGRERVLRVEDLRARPEAALRAWCDWLDIEYQPALCNGGLAALPGHPIRSGATALIDADFEPRLLTHYDRLKVRAVLREEYRAWGYAARARLDDSIAELERDPAARQCPFAVQTLLAQMDHDTGLRSTADGASKRLAELDHLQRRVSEIRTQRDGGWRPIPLLLAAEQEASR